MPQLEEERAKRIELEAKINISDDESNK